jgi:lysophospholipase L1-like esterase
VKPGLTYDGVHPTPAGYALMEPVMVAAVDKVLAAP